jgi:hypothetical protein
MLCKIYVRISKDTKLQQKVNFKRVCQEMNFFLKAYDNKKVLSAHALIVFTILCSQLIKKIKLQVLAFAFEITF